MSVKGKKIIASTITVVAAKKYGSRTVGRELAMTGCNPTKKSAPNAKIIPFA